MKDWNRREEVTPLRGEWTVDFFTEHGGPGTLMLPELMDWTTHSDERVKYYSGTAVYRHVLSVGREDETIAGRYLLRFDKLGDVARVRLNGEEAGIVWCSPWEIDVTPYLKAGENRLEIEVANSLMNRMIKDSMLPQNERVTYAVPPVASPGYTLIPSGIVGPVSLVKQSLPIPSSISF